MDFVAGARESLDAAVQELDSEPLAQALIDARFRRVRACVFLEHLLSPAAALRDELMEQRSAGPQDQLRRHLRRAVVATWTPRPTYNPAIFHQKFVVRDNRERHAAAATLSGSANFTDTDCHRNLNHMSSSTTRAS